ncbi:hypothetical protein [Haloechinothrix halophila]|uniref:hypothetical protein n=1 Tax=Haloechinothrix halophila TaxID=1069073 RepID=UPI0004235C4D|nr:hypothetical protein [Haloechinothrix halophila]
MAASTHSQDARARRRAPSAPQADDPAETLVSDGLRLMFGAPELALVSGERAAALAEASGSERVWAYAEGLSVSARVRLGHRADVVNRAVVVLRTAEADGHADLAAQMRTELALCARSVGVPLTGLAALRPVLADEHAQPVCRIGALLQFVGCMASIGRRGVLDRALEEADKLADSDPGIGDADRVSMRALVQARTAAHLRRHGDISASIDAARNGLDIVEGSDDVLVDSTQMRTRLTLELVCALLDQGSRDEADALAQPLFAEPARAASIAPLAWMRLAIATRVHLASAAPETAGMLIRDALHHTRRHDLLALSSRLLLELSHIEEQLGRPAEALTCLREARVCEHSYGRLRRQALGLLTGEFGRGEQPAADFNRALAEHEERVAQQRKSQPAGKRRRVEPSTETTQMMPAVTADAPPPRSEPARPEPAPSTSASPEPGFWEPASWETTSSEPAAPANRPSSAAYEDSPASHEAAPARPSTAPWETVQQPAVPWAKHSAPQEADQGARHQADRTSSVRSVLDRLGVAVGSGGRRHASDDEPDRRGRHEQPDHTAGTGWTEQPAQPSWTEQPAQPSWSERPVQPSWSERPVHTPWSDQPAHTPWMEQRDERSKPPSRPPMPWEQPAQEQQPPSPSWAERWEQRHSEPPHAKPPSRPAWTAQPANAEWSWRPDPRPEPEPEPAPEPTPEEAPTLYAAPPDVRAEPLFAPREVEPEVPQRPEVEIGSDTSPEPDRTPEPAPEPQPVRELDSVLAVFSSWANGDDDNSAVTPRVRSRRWQRTETSGSASGHRGTNGHAVNGDSPLRGNHGGGPI